MPCKICNDTELRELLDIELKVGHSYSWIIAKFNPQLLAQKKPLINSKDLSLHKRNHLIPSLTPDDIKELEDEFQIILYNGNFINPQLLNKTIYKKDN